MGERNNMKIYHYILIVGGLLLTLNVIYPPMYYENYQINDGYKTARHFITTTKVDKKDYEKEKIEIIAPNVTVTRGGKFTYIVKLNVSRLVVQEFLILGIMSIALGFTIPKDKVTLPTT